MTSTSPQPRRFYSIPPSGNLIPAAGLARAVSGLWGNAGHAPFEFMRDAFGGAHVFSLPSGRAALWLILKAQSMLKPRKRDVIIPAYTCPAVASAVLKAGLRPVLVDMDDHDFGLARKGLNDASGRDVLAVVIVHLFGYPAGLDNVRDWCARHDAFLVEDSAQAFGNSAPDSPERSIGLEADAGFFSFGRGKPMSVLYGGVAITASDEIAHCAADIYRALDRPGAVSAMKYAATLSMYLLFSRPELYWVPENIRFLHLGETIFEPDFEISKGLRLPELILREMTGLVAQERAIRERNSAWYAEAFRDVPGVAGPPAPAFPFLRYPLVLETEGQRDRVLAELKRHGTGASLFYPLPLNELPGLREVLQDNGVYPIAKGLSERLITLPVHSRVTPECRETIRSIVVSAVDPVN